MNSYASKMFADQATTTKRPRAAIPIHFIIIAAVGLILLLGVAVMYFLDKKLVARTVSQRESVGKSYRAASSQGANSVNLDQLFFDASQGKTSALLSGAEALRNGDINASNARSALRNAPASAIQEAIQSKSGKSVSVGKIEQARTKALSSDGQNKINEALKRRGEVDISKIRERLTR